MRVDHYHFVGYMSKTIGPESCLGEILHTPLYCGGKFWVAPPGHTPFFALRICGRRCFVHETFEHLKDNKEREKKK